MNSKFTMEHLNIIKKRKSSKKNVFNLQPKKKVKGEISIKSTEGSYCFRTESYNEARLGTIIYKADYDKIIQKASIILGDSLLKKREFDKFKVPTWSKVISIFSFILILIYLFLLYFAQSKTDGDAALGIAVACVSLAIVLTVFQSIYVFCRKTRPYRTLNEIIDEDMKDYLEKVNEQLRKKNYSRNLRFDYFYTEKINLQDENEYKERELKCFFDEPDFVDQINHPIAEQVPVEQNTNKQHEECKASKEIDLINHPSIDT